MDLSVPTSETAHIPRIALSVPTAAKAASLGKSTLWAAIADKELPVVRRGRRTLVLVSDLEGWIRAGRQVA